MTNVRTLSDRPSLKRERLHLSEKAVARELWRAALGHAYGRVLERHPEVTVFQERLDLAVQMAIGALYMTAKDLTEDVPVVAQIEALP